MRLVASNDNQPPKNPVLGLKIALGMSTAAWTVIFLVIRQFVLSS